MAGRDELLALLADIDTWLGERDRTCEITIMGGAPLILAWNKKDPTKDLDVVVRGHAEVEAKGLADLEAEFGKPRDPFLEIVNSGLPCLPEGWSGRTESLAGPWTHLTVRRLSAGDQVAAKLKAWRPHDRRDIEFLLTVEPAARGFLAALGPADYWYAEDIWEERIEPRRDRVLDWVDGRVAKLD